MDAVCRRLVHDLGEALRAHGWRLATAESCTGGLLASTLTDVPGSSEWFEGGVVAYDNRVKICLLSVDQDLLLGHGAVSRDCVEAMVRGLCRLLDVAVGLAISGIAGPSGGSSEKPVGTVWIACSLNGRVSSKVHHFAGDRLAIKEQSALTAVAELLDRLMKKGASESNAP